MSNDIAKREEERLKRITTKTALLFKYFQKYPELSETTKEKLKILNTKMGHLFDNFNMLSYMENKESKDYLYAIEETINQLNAAENDYDGIVSEFPTSIMSEYLDEVAAEKERKMIREARKEQISRGLKLDKVSRCFDWEKMETDPLRDEWTALYSRAVGLAKSSVRLNELKLAKTMIDYEDIPVEKEFYSELDDAVRFLDDVNTESGNLIKEIMYVGTQNLEGLEDRIQAFEDEITKLKEKKEKLFADMPDYLLSLMASLVNGEAHHVD